MQPGKTFGLHEEQLHLKARMVRPGTRRGGKKKEKEGKSRGQIRKKGSP